MAKKYRLDYTRYVDDLTFSTNDKHFLNIQDEFYKLVDQEIKKAGFKINAEKTRLQFKDSNQEVTGLTVNKKVNINKLYYRKTRAMAHSLYTNGYFQIDGKPGTVEKLEGRLVFINQIDWHNNRSKKKRKKNNIVNAREKEYTKFIFYKYFYMNKKPMIITEGKTDIIYLKAALKRFYREYPKLISRKDNGDFEFKATFFNRKSKRFRYFFDLEFDGADTVTQFIKKYYVNSSNLVKYFKKMSNIPPKQPIVCVYDNELSNKNKPINNIFSNDKNEIKKREELISKHYINWVDNVYILTNPLVQGKEECEIEDLFDDKVLNHEIKGRKFEKIVKDSSEPHYPKHDFSVYIAKNYTTIDFSRFKPMLNNLNSIISEYGNE